MTGPGKGKTTAALGVILRSLSCGRKTLLARFGKSRNSGELDILAKLPGMEIRNSSLGMAPPPGHPEREHYARAASDLFAAVMENTDRFDTLVLDEACWAVASGLLSEKKVIEWTKALPADRIVVLTGRDATAGLIAVADTVSEVLSLKHGYARGIAAQEGIEY